MSELTDRSRLLPTLENQHPYAADQQLCAFLISGGYSQERLRREGFTKAKLPELKALAAQIAESLKPADPLETTARLERLFSHYPQSAMADEQFEGRWEDWLDDLSALPSDIIAAGCRDWRRSQERFSPTPGQFLDKTAPYMSARVFMERAVSKAISALESIP